MAWCNACGVCMHAGLVDASRVSVVGGSHGGFLAGIVCAEGVVSGVYLMWVWCHVTLPVYSCGHMHTARQQSRLNCRWRLGTVCLTFVSVLTVHGDSHHGKFAVVWCLLSYWCAPFKDQDIHGRHNGFMSLTSLATGVALACTTLLSC